MGDVLPEKKKNKASEQGSDILQISELSHRDYKITLLLRQIAMIFKGAFKKEPIVHERKVILLLWIIKQNATLKNDQLINGFISKQDMYEDTLWTLHLSVEFLKQKYQK